MNNQPHPPITQLLKRLERALFIIASLSAIVIGFVFLLYVPFPFANSLGIALFTSGTIGLLLRYFTHRQFEDLIDHIVATAMVSTVIPRIEELRTLMSLEGDLRSLGVRRIHRDRKAIDFLSYLDKVEPKSDIRILGTALMGFTGWPTQQTIEKLLEAGCNIRMLALDPESKFLEQRAEEENRTYEDIKAATIGTNRIIDAFIRHQLPSGLRQRIEFRTYDAPPLCFTFSSGERMIVGFYLRGKRGEFSPHLELEIKEGGISHAFLEHFESLWLTSKRLDGQESHGDEHQESK